MKKHSSFPKIGQYRQVIKDIRMRSSYMGKDADGNPIYDNSRIFPKVTFKGSVKLHGTNGGVAHTEEDGIWAQSRENIITVEHDNFGFAFFVESRKEVFTDLIQQVRSENHQINPNDIVVIFGEWAGSSIQKGVGIMNIPKTFFIFAVKVEPEDGSPSYYLDSDNLRSVENRIYNINDFVSYSLEIDLNQPEMVQNKLSEITLAIEEMCPVAKEFGYEGVGEGVVWVAKYDNQIYRFKVKGDKHSASKVKTLASVDVEKINSINEFVEYAVTENRFNQGIGVIFPDGQLDVKKLGDVIKWVVSDVISEEVDVLNENNLEPKDVGKYISTKTRQMFFDQYNKF